MHFGPKANARQQLKKGTTTLAFIYEPATPNDKGGIVVAVDSRASAGQYICKLLLLIYFLMFQSNCRKGIY